MDRHRTDRSAHNIAHEVDGDIHAVQAPYTGVDAFATTTYERLESSGGSQQATFLAVDYIRTGGDQNGVPSAILRIT
jgi:hypothetical protein